jgi:hypothetical protein
MRKYQIDVYKTILEQEFEIFCKKKISSIVIHCLLVENNIKDKKHS